MTINYFGKNIEECREYPEAEILYDENDKKEAEKMDAIIEILEAMGWKCFAEYGMTCIPLYNGMYEYKELVNDYKKAKKMAQEVIQNERMRI